MKFEDDGIIVDGGLRAKLEPAEEDSALRSEAANHHNQKVWQYKTGSGEVVQDDSTAESIFRVDQERRVTAAFTYRGLGSFRTLTAESLKAELKDGSEEEAVASGEMADAPEGSDEVDSTANKDEEKSLSFEDMLRLKEEVFLTLTNAWQELSFISELSRSLIPGQTHPYTDPRLGPAYIPANALTATHVPNPTEYVAQDVHNARLAVARQGEAIKNARGILDDSVKRMRKRQGREETYWDLMKTLRYAPKPSNAKGNHVDAVATPEPAHSTRVWPLLPKWTIDGTPESKQIAKDVMIPYALDEAAAHIRNRALAFPKPENEATQSVESTSTSTELLVLPARSGKRLRIKMSIQQDDGNSQTLCSQWPGRDGTDSEGSPDTLLTEAQNEAFDQEVFEEIVREARGNSLLEVTISVDRLSCRPVPGVELAFELINVEEQMSGGHSQSSTPDLVLSVVKLCMIRLYRIRQRDRKVSAEGGGDSRGVRSILATVIPYLHYQAFTKQLIAILNGYRLSLAEMGMSLEILRRDGGLAGGLDWESLLKPTQQADMPVSLSRNIDLLFDAKHLASILITPSCQLILSFPDRTVVSQDLAQLPIFLGAEIKKLVLQGLAAIAQAKNVEVEVDDIDGVLRTRSTKISIRCNENIQIFADIVKRVEDRRISVDRIDLRGREVYTWAKANL